MIVPSPRRSASKTRVDALNRGEGATVLPRNGSGEGDAPRTELSKIAPHPNPLPVNGERERTELAALTDFKPKEKANALDA